MYIDFPDLVARFLVVYIFLHSAGVNFKDFSAGLTRLESKSIPHPSLFLPIIMIIKFFASIVIILDIFVPLASFALVILTIASSCVFHDFWNKKGEECKTDKVWWTLNISVIGGLMLLITR